MKDANSRMANGSENMNNQQEEKEMNTASKVERGGEEYISVTGDPGMTGGPGMPGGYSDQESSFEKMVKQASFETMVGATGVGGGKGDQIEEVRKEYKYEDLIAKLKAEIPEIMDEGVLIPKINESCAEYDDLFEKTNAMVASKAYVAGMYLNQLQFVRTSRKKRDWGFFAAKTFPKLKKTPRENRMNIANLPGVEGYFTLGVERLAEFGRYYNNLTEKDQMLLGENPIGTILEKHKVNMSLPIDENRIKIDAVLAHYDLAKKNVQVEPEVLEKFFKANHKITTADRKHMITIAKEEEDAPAKYLIEVIAAGGDRTELIGEAAPNSEYVDTKIKNLDTQVAKLDKSLEKVFEQGALDGKVNLEAIDKLIERLEKLRSTLRYPRG